VTKETWLPAYVKERRRRTEAHLDAQENPLKFLWGNTPSFDLLNLKDNEGLEYDKDMNILFAGKNEHEFQLDFQNNF
jgi:hypothetical protein